MSKKAKRIKAKMFQAYCEYRWEDRHREGTDVVPYRMALAIDLLCESCYGHDLIDYWYALDEGTQEDVAFGMMSTKQIVKLMDYLKLSIADK